jgi:hypothetical protein
VSSLSRYGRKNLQSNSFTSTGTKLDSRSCQLLAQIGIAKIAITSLLLKTEKERGLLVNEQLCEKSFLLEHAVIVP